MIILGTNSIKDTGYDVANSCRFNDDDSPNMQKTISTTGNRKTATFSTWIKKSKLGEQWFLNMGGNYSTGYNTKIGFDSNDRIFIIDQSSGTNLRLQCTQSFRDTSAWYNFIVVFDTTQGTASNRVKFFVNGSQVTSFGTETYPDQNEDLQFNLNTSSKNLAVVGSRLNNVADNFDGYLAETVWIDGTAYGADSFGEFDEDSGIWKPIDVSGLTFGTNGFYLPFTNASALGEDFSGNNNDFTVNNLTAIDQTTDTCTNNFATLNPLVPLGTFSEGNTVWDSVATGDGCAFSTIGVASGKWYAEVKCTGSITSGFGVGVVPMQLMTGSASGGGTATIGGVEYVDARVLRNGSDATGTITGISQNDIIGIALNMDDAEVKFYLNNTVQEGGTTISLPSGGFWCFSTSDYNSGSATQASMNFGNPAYSLTSAANDANGYGNFEYAPPSGYYALNTKNLAEYG